jgi:thioredoxin 1
MSDIKNMNNLKFISFFLLLIISCCQNAVSQRENVLSVKDFEQRLKTTPDAQIIDVRTSEEFEEGHLKNALSLDILSDDLKNRSKYLDKEKPLFVYCYTGGRSARACDIFRKEGFKIVYDMQGGYSKWSDANMPVEKVNPSTSVGISKEAFDKIISSNKKVIVDVYAKWCAPCMKMEGDLENLTNEFKNTVTVLRIEKDKNTQLAKELGVNEIPVFFIYQNGKLILTAEGYRDLAGLRELFNM